MNKGKTAAVSGESDIFQGPLALRILMFTIPLILSSILQLCFNAADTIVVGRFAGEEALAAVGSTGSLINLIINAFMGLSTGVSVTVSHAWGAKMKKDVSAIVHTAVSVAFIGGCCLAVIGFAGCRYFLTWMGSPENVIGLSTLYMRIYFLGMPASMVYNFCAAILRSTGDTKHPMVFLITAGVANVILNLITVIVFGLGVAGVAIATVFSQCVSCFLILRYLMKRQDACRLILRELRVERRCLENMVRIGLPAGLQSSIFSVSNVIIQSSVNSFGSTVMAGNATSANLEGFVYMAMNAYYHASLTFVGQHVGARKVERVPRILITNLVIVTLTGLLSGLLIIAFRYQLYAVYRPDSPEVWEYASQRTLIFLTTYYTCGMMETLTGTMRGMGSSLLPMGISVLGVCGVRIVWIFTVFRYFHTLRMLYLSYPVSWIFTVLVQLIAFAVLYHRLKTYGTIHGRHHTVHE